MYVKAMEQTALTFAFGADEYFESFYVSAANAPLIKALDRFVWASGEPERLSDLNASQSLYLWGDRGVGKTHLVSGVCQRAHQRGLRAGYLDLAEAQAFGFGALNDLDVLDVVCWDNLDSVLMHPHEYSDWEEPLLHAFNRLRDSDVKLIMTSAVPVAALRIELADLKTRLDWGLNYRIVALNDDDKVNALIQIAGQRGISLPESVARFILRRIDRNMLAITRVLDQLDADSLRHQRKITVPFVKACLGW